MIDPKLLNVCFSESGLRWSILCVNGCVKAV